MVMVLVPLASTRPSTPDTVAKALAPAVPAVLRMRLSMPAPPTIVADGRLPIATTNASLPLPPLNVSVPPLEKKATATLLLMALASTVSLPVPSTTAK